MCLQKFINNKLTHLFYSCGNFMLYIAGILWSTLAILKILIGMSKGAKRSKNKKVTIPSHNKRIIITIAMEC